MRIPMSNVCRPFAVTAFLLLSLPVEAQHVGGNPGPCPGGAAPVNGSCGSPSNAGIGVNAQPREIWRDRYGAIAASAGGSNVGTAKDQNSMRAARKVAMKKCVGPACKIVVEYVNGCGSVAWGPQNGGVASYAYGENFGAATEKALRKCRDGGGGECETTGTTCSLPERVQ